MDVARSHLHLGQEIFRLTFSSLGRCQMGEYSSSFGNVGERACACRGARIPEEERSDDEPGLGVRCWCIFLFYSMYVLAMDGEDVL